MELEIERLSRSKILELNVRLEFKRPEANTENEDQVLS